MNSVIEHQQEHPISPFKTNMMRPTEYIPLPPEQCGPSQAYLDAVEQMHIELGFKARLKETLSVTVDSINLTASQKDLFKRKKPAAFIQGSRRFGKTESNYQYRFGMWFRQLVELEEREGTRLAVNPKNHEDAFIFGLTPEEELLQLKIEGGVL